MFDYKELLEETIRDSNGDDNKDEIHFESQSYLPKTVSNNMNNFLPKLKLEKKSFSRQYGASLIGDDVDQVADNIKKVDLTSIVFMMESIHASANKGSIFQCHCKTRVPETPEQQSDRSGIRALIWSAPKQTMKCYCRLQVQSKKQCIMM
jgi:hypothetical protein